MSFITKPMDTYNNAAAFGSGLSTDAMINTSYAASASSDNVGYGQVDTSEFGLGYGQLDPGTFGPGYGQVDTSEFGPGYGQLDPSGFGPGYGQLDPNEFYAPGSPNIGTDWF